MRNLYIIGIGMGNPDTITVKGRDVIGKCEALIGAKRMVDSFVLPNQKYYHAISPAEILNWIEANEQLDSIAVLMSGDVGFFSGAKKLRELVTDKYGDAKENNMFKVEGIPGISSLSYFTAKLGMSWEDAKIVSLHGREDCIVSIVQNNPKTFFLTDSGNHAVKNICNELCDADLGKVKVYVGEKLSYEDEKITYGIAENLATHDFDSLSVMLIENEKFISRDNATIGIVDDEFIRGNVPMTKEEVRTLTISKLNLHLNDIVYDIGAGTGSVSIELSLACSLGEVFAVETNEEAIELIKVNRDKFNVKNLHIVEGLAPEALADLPMPDKAFIGGSKGNLDEIIQLLINKNPNIRIAINVVTLETLAEAVTCLKKYKFIEVDITQVNISKAKALGNYNLMVGQNPVYIICGTAKAE
jgi:precorrin-6Y C5,15-methyltransferase (decarboxylating)